MDRELRNVILSAATAADINIRIDKVLKGLGNPEPPLRLEDVRELLRLDRGYYSTADDSFLQEMISKLKVAGVQVLERPNLLLEAVKKFDLRALYLPDRKRILLDRSQPAPKLRWNEAHEIGHSLIPWHEDLMLGDNEHSLAPACHAQIEAEANFAAGQLLFLRDKFTSASKDTVPSLHSILALKGHFGNTITTTFWRFVEESHSHIPMLGMIGPHPKRQLLGVGAVSPFKYLIESPAFKTMFPSVSARELHKVISSYCGVQKSGPLGTAEVILLDKNGERHLFVFESFSNTYDCLSLATYARPHAKAVGF